MAFQVTPETDVSEAAMFHGARVELSSNFSLSGGFNTVEFDEVVFDTDGFWDAANYEFVIPEGVALVRAGTTLTVNDSVAIEVKARVRTGGVASHAIVLDQSVNVSQVNVNIDTGPIPVSAGDGIFVDIRYQHTPTACAVIASAGSTPTAFWIEVLKTPIGYPESPTLPA